MSLAEAAQEGQTDLEYLVILPAGLQSSTSFTVSVTMSSLAHPEKTVTLQADIQVHSGLVALPGGLQVPTQHLQTLLVVSCTAMSHFQSMLLASDEKLPL